MSEKEMQFIKVLKRWVLGLSGAVVLSVGGGIFTSWRAGIVNEERIQEINNSQIKQDVLIEKKADAKMVTGIKESLETELSDKYDAINGKLDLLVQMLPIQNTYYTKSTINNKK